ncbi:hypothetical protein I3842_06G077200 [Carya illinoinensis]|uniref:Uncharacterized protein n=1 Tax=Carya illinoinensis TaxID=32201 RepID=A0A922JHY0_CARIL|nr:hypothetical protein I3842_06G077200 [Carya illinoinensis]
MSHRRSRLLHSIPISASYLLSFQSVCDFDMDKSWMRINDRFRSAEYKEGVHQFIILAQAC